MLKDTAASTVKTHWDVMILDINWHSAMSAPGVQHVSGSDQIPCFHPENQILTNKSIKQLSLSITFIQIRC